MIQENLIITKREAEVINKRLLHKKLTQQDSNYLSRYVRPKLKEMMKIDSKSLLQKIEYNQKAPAIEIYIKQIVVKSIPAVSSITIYGSAVYNNYQSYNDIDVMVAVKKKSWKKLGEKYDKIIELKKESKKHGLKLDISIYSEKVLYHGYSSMPSLVYQLKDRKTIYGKLNLPSKIEIPKIELRMKLDYSGIEEDASGEEIYKAIRNLWLVRLILKKNVDNLNLKNILYKELGENLVERLKSNRCSKADRKIGKIYLDKMLEDTRKEIIEARWEKIVL